MFNLPLNLIRWYLIESFSNFVINVSRNKIDFFILWGQETHKKSDMKSIINKHKFNTHYTNK